MVLKKIGTREAFLLLWNYSELNIGNNNFQFVLLGLCLQLARPRMGSLGQNSVQADAFWGGYFLGEYLFLENDIPDIGFLGLSNAIYMQLL